MVAPLRNFFTVFGVNSCVVFGSSFPSASTKKSIQIVFFCQNCYNFSSKKPIDFYGWKLFRWCEGKNSQNLTNKKFAVHINCWQFSDTLLGVLLQIRSKTACKFGHLQKIFQSAISAIFNKFVIVNKHFDQMTVSNA